MEPIITTLIVIGIIVLAIALGVMFIKHKLNSVTKDYLGMNLKETSELIKKGLKDEVSTPKSISNVSAMYKPQLTRDFPDISYERFLEMANSSLMSILTAIEKESTSELSLATDTLKEKVYNIISDNHNKGLVEHFDNIKIHRTAIADYKSSSDKATAIFEISFECLHYFEGKKNKVPDNVTQMAASVTFSYGREYAEDSTSLTFSHNCPNCGAPVYSVGGRMMQCKFCGTGVTEDVHRSWLVSGYKFI